MTEKDVMDNQKPSNVMENESKTVTETEKPSFPNLMVQNVYQAIKMNRKAKYSQLEDNLGVSDGGSGGQISDSLLSWNCRRSATSGYQCVLLGVLTKSGTMGRYIGSLFRVDVPFPDDYLQWLGIAFKQA